MGLVSICLKKLWTISFSKYLFVEGPLEINIIFEYHSSLRSIFSLMSAPYSWIPLFLSKNLDEHHLSSKHPNNIIKQ